MYKVIKPFRDLQDGNHRYIPGDEYPRSGLEVSQSRLEELSTANNRIGYPVIEIIKEKPKVAEMASGEPKMTNKEVVEEVTEEPKEIPEKKEEKPKPKKGRGKKNAD